MLRRLALPILLLLCSLSAAGPSSAVAAESELSLAERMALVDVDWKRLKKQIPRPAKNEDSLELIGYIQEQVVLGKRMVPSAAGEMPEDDRAEFVTAYRLGMIEFLAHLLAMEKALLAGDNRGAFAEAKKIGVLQIRSHERFKKDQEE